MNRRLLTVGMAGLAVSCLLQSPAAAQGADPGVLVIGVPGLRWEHISAQRTPAIWQLAEDGAIGSLSVRAGIPVTRRFDGWITMGAGNRARARAEVLPDVVGGVDPAIAPLRKDNATLSFDAEIGALGDALADAGIPRRAFGRGAELALADSSGDLGGPAAMARVVVHELLGAYSSSPTDAELAELDTAVGDVVRTRAANDTVILVGVSGGADTPPHLQVAVVAGPDYRGGRLRSASTRRDGYVQLIDLAPTILDVLDVEPPRQMVGQPMRRVGGRRGSEIAQLVDADVASDAHRRYVPPFFTLLVATQLGLYGIAWRGLKRRPRGTAGHDRLRSFTRHAALVFASVPCATYLVQIVPWWRHRLWYLLLAVAVATAVVYGVAALGPWRRSVLGPAGVVAAITATVLAVDLMTGATLQMSSLAGYSPIVAGRFAGVGNVAFAVFATSALLATAAVCVGRSRRTCIAVTAAVGIVAVAIDGNPSWGSDFGGVLALVPGFAVLGMLLVGARLSWRRLVVIGLLAGALVTAFALLDYSRAPDARSHLGRFVQQIADGGAGTIIRRKAQANLRLLTHSVLTLVVPLAVGFLAFVLLRPWGGLRRALEHTPPLRAGLVAVLVMAVTGFFANDSGVAVPAFALTLAVPIALAASIRTSEVLGEH